MKFTLEFKDKIGQQIEIKDEHRFCFGVFNGSASDRSGIYLKVDDRRIKISHDTEIEFKKLK